VTKYETTLILDPGLDDNRVNEEIEKVQQLLKNLGGEVLEVQRWGKRRMAYEIHKKRDGVYVWILHQGGGALVPELERQVHLNESMLRVLTVLHVPVEPTQPKAEAAAGAADETEASEE
jgi:small subunit ribosomal protein S6